MEGRNMTEAPDFRLTVRTAAGVRLGRKLARLCDGELTGKRDDRPRHMREQGIDGKFLPGFTDLTDRRFTRLTVLRQVVPRRISYAIEWECRCKCGTLKTIRSSSLLDGTTQSCGCLSRERRVGKAEDYTGRIFGRLTVSGRLAALPGGKSTWLCDCTCGAQIARPAAALKDGSTTSCGCLERDQKAQRRALFLGQQFGRLLVLYEAESAVSHKARFWCECECGRKKVISANSLKQGTVSCGCAMTNHDPALRTDHQKLQGRRFRQTRLARQQGATGTFTDDDIMLRLKWQKGRCAAPNCRILLKGLKYHIDHIEPLSPRYSKAKNRENLNAARNIQILCEPCNSAKLDKDPITWAQSLGFML